MNLWDIVKTVGAGALNVALPGAGSAILGAVNAALPVGRQLTADATGHDVDNALHSLPPAERAEVMRREFDVDITQIKEAHSTVRAMLDADATSTHTTRPWIAKWSFVFTALFSGSVGLTLVGLWAYAVYKQDAALVTAIVNGWPFVLAVLGSVTGVFATLLKAYFGVLTQEHKNRLSAATGNSTPSGLAGIVSALLTKKG